MPKSTSLKAKLSDSQLVILSTAAQRADGSLLPFPASLSAKGAALDKVVETLCKRKLVEERRAINGAPEWRRGDDGHPLGLFITNTGLLSLGVDGADRPKPAQAASMPRRRKTGVTAPLRRPRKASQSRPRGRASASQSKQDVVIKMLRRRSGVTIEHIMAETGWQAHSVRGFFSGAVKKKLKLPLVSDVGKDGVRRYHIAPLKSAKA